MSEQPDPPPPATAKLDPESLAIRARPARAIRFRRGVIIAGAAIGSASLMGIAWMALQPQIFSRQTQESELSQPMNKPSADALANLPASYGDVPKLGPPLPGDLGRPILKAQQQMATDAGARAGMVDDQAALRAQRLAELKAARESGLMVQVRGGDAGKAATETPSAIVAASVAPEPQPAGKSRKEQFTERQDKDSDLNGHALTPAASPYMVSAGSVIAASLITGLNSDLPGTVTAQVTQHLFDTATGRILLIPQGARLIGKYDSVVAFGQRRALVVWQRLMLPDGSSLRLDNMPATDPSGYAGLADKVDFHSWSLLKGVAIATLLGVGSELTISGESDLVEAIRESAQSNTARAGDQVTQRNLDIQPTITIRPGAPVRVLVTRDLILAPWRG